MALYLYDKFVSDLRNHSDPAFAKRALNKVFDEDGLFRSDRNDHRYGGIDDAWIRYVSQGVTGWRAIFIRRGDDVFLYRAGEHSIEDNLNAPKRALAVHSVARIAGSEVHAVAGEGAAVTEKRRLLSSLFESELQAKILSRRLCPHKDIVLISHTVDPRCLAATTRLGRVLYDLCDEGANVTIMTRPPRSLELLREFSSLESRGINFLFNEAIEANLFIFKLKDGFDYQAQASGLADAAYLGSAPLTMESMEASSNANDNLIYEILDFDISHADDYAAGLAARSLDVVGVRTSLAGSN